MNENQVSHQQSTRQIDGRSVPSQPLVDWLARQYDQPLADRHGPWAAAWDGAGLKTHASGGMDASR